jgi:hypothetical protein
MKSSRVVQILTSLHKVVCEIAGRRVEINNTNHK